MKKIILLFAAFGFFSIKNQAQTVTDIDGNIYNTVTIGTQIWMHENLKVTHYLNGVSIPNIIDSIQWCNLTNGALCNYNNDTGNISTYGSLYNWYAVTDSRNLCPGGWHLPSETELTTLINFVGVMGANGGKMKELGCAHWACPNALADDSSGFTALPGGYRNGYNGYGFYSMLTFHSGWWTSTSYDPTNAWILNLNYDNGAANNYFLPKTFGFYVRCIKGNSSDIERIDINKKIKIYPNPTIDRVSIDFAERYNVNIQIYNIFGELVLQRELKSGSNEIDVNLLSKGIFIIKITGADWTIKRKLVKE